MITYFGALIGEQSRAFSPDALSGSSDDGNLSCEHATRIVEVRADLCCTLGRHDVL